ncbi:MAG: sodium:calcium antiporter [Thermoplasmata archaeon]|nr:sodium:calcium antiporter [Thermoplasmata archaeon]
MIIELFLMILGFLFLWKGSDLTVDASKRLATKFGISHAVIGLTLVSVGTSLPEIFTNIYTGLRVNAGHEVSGIAVGMILGSQISQITFILGAAALVGVMYASEFTFKRDVPMMFVAIAMFFMVGLDGEVTQVEGAILITVYLVYLFMINKQDHVAGNIKNELKNGNHKEINTAKQGGIALLGLLILIIGGILVVNNAETIAAEFGISNTLIGILVIGPGAALPELSVAVSGMKKHAEGVSLGALIGSNITDPLLSFGAGVVIAGFTFDKGLLWFDIPYWTLATAIAVALMWPGHRIGSRKTSGIILISLFVVYAVLKIAML